MILQRMAGAIRRQDWFQVIIEILIVVIGIFLGLQVQAWYEAGEAESREKILLTQLHSEIMETLPINREQYQEKVEVRPVF